jgi:hypothetical protein
MSHTFNKFFGKSSVSDKDLGFGEIQEQLKLIDRSVVKVGFQQNTVTHNQTKRNRTKVAGLSMPQIAADNEYGTRKIPARPFMSTSYDENSREINQIISIEYNKILAGKRTVEKSLGLIGQYMKGKIQQKIRQIRFPPNSPVTISIKKSSKPLIDFGQMIQSVRSVIVLRKK